MSEHPIFDDKERQWTLSMNNVDLDACAEYWPNNQLIFVRVKKGYVARLLRPGDEYLSTSFYPTAAGNVPDWNLEIKSGYWDEFIVPYIIPEQLIDMTGEFDGDDIELAMIIMEEIEGERR